jgi:HEPN domain-containing protein
MESHRDALYRLRLAEGFLEEAEQDHGLERWRAVVNNSQLAAENGAKAALALILPPSRVHDPGRLLIEALDQGRFRDDQAETVRALAECAESLGPDMHIQTDYGDETGGRTPWEIFRQEDAQQALELARQATELARSLVAADSEFHAQDQDTD